MYYLLNGKTLLLLTSLTRALYTLDRKWANDSASIMDKHPTRQIHESTFPRNILFHKVGVTAKLMPVHNKENFMPTP